MIIKLKAEILDGRDSVTFETRDGKPLMTLRHVDGVEFM